MPIVLVEAPEPDRFIYYVQGTADGIKWSIKLHSHGRIETFWMTLDQAEILREALRRAMNEMTTATRAGWHK